MNKSTITFRIASACTLFANFSSHGGKMITSVTQVKIFWDPSITDCDEDSLIPHNPICTQTVTVLSHANDIVMKFHQVWCVPEFSNLNEIEITAQL